MCQVWIHSQVSVKVKVNTSLSDKATETILQPLVSAMFN